jgi:DNA-binding LacI/PurR family transcriptional regulator
MANLPRRYSLVAQVGDILQMEIKTGVLKESLPSELELAKRFQVSRPTIRDALQILRKAGLIESTRGQNHRIVLQKGKPEPVKLPGGVVVLGFAPLDELSPFSLSLISQVQQAARSKFEVKIIASPHLASPAALRELTEGQAHRCWVLIGPPPEVLQWFESSRLPCLALAPSIASTKIPCLAMDVQSVILHSFSLAAQRGYSGPLLLLPSSSQNSEIMRSFTLAQAKYPNADAAAFTHDSSVAGVRRTIDKFARARIGKGSPPLILVLRPKHALMGLCALMARDLKPGKHFGLISIGRETYLDYMTPSMACYTINRQKMFKKFLRMFTEILDSGYSRPELFKLIADFCEGETFPRISKK